MGWVCYMLHRNKLGGCYFKPVARGTLARKSEQMFRRQQTTFRALPTRPGTTVVYSGRRTGTRTRNSIHTIPS